MARPLKLRKPRAAEIGRLLLWVEEPLETAQQRRAQAILLYNEGMNATEIAQTLEVHPNTIYADLHAFNQWGLASIEQSTQRGRPVRLTAEQKAAICRLAEQPPCEVGLPYGRWSLSKLRTYLIRQHIVSKISCEYIRRILKKGGSVYGMSSVSYSVAIPSVQPFSPAFVGAGGICPTRPSWSFSMSSRWSSKRMGDDAIPRRNAWCWSVGKRRAVDSICFCCMR